MCVNHRCAIVALLLYCWIIAVASAQNLNSYQSIAEPYLFLLREPAIHEELKLTQRQLVALSAVNDALDGQLVAMQNLPADKQRETMTTLIAESQQRVDTIFDAGQRQRISQIMLQIRGIRSVVSPKVAKRLALSADQVNRIEKKLKETQEETNKIVKQIREGQPKQSLMERAMKLRKEEQEGIFASLTARQQKELIALLGPMFKQSRLGRVRFKAPELIDGDGWINSRPQRIADLRGQVVAVHFWAFA
jgi:hypothetical protein